MGRGNVSLVALAQSAAGEVQGSAWVRTVRNSAVVGFLVMAVVREGVGDAGKVGLVHFFSDGVVEALVR